MGRQLLLHIGGHKTGTSSIQNALYENQAYLDELGYKFYFTSKNGEDWGNGRSTGWFKRDGDFCNGLQIDLQLAETLGNIEGNIVFSQENFSWIFSREAIQAFHEELNKYFAQILVIVYIRRQDKLAISHHQQGSRTTRRFDSVFYGNENKALPCYREHLQKYLDFNQRIGMWADIFGDNHIKLRIFDKKYLIKEDVVSDFFNLLGVRGEFHAYKLNKSNGFVKSKVNHLINRIEVEEDRRLILSRKLDNTGKLEPARQKAIDFYMHFRESNRLLNQRFNLTAEEFLFDDNFDFYPQEAGDVWTEDSANDAILNLLQGITSMPIIRQCDAGLFLQCISALRGIDKHSAGELQRLFDKYYPNHVTPGWKQRCKELIGKLHARVGSLAGSN